MQKKIAFIGHRKIYQHNLNDLLFRTVEKYIEDGYTTFAVGTHGDFDILTLSVLRQLRRKYQHIVIEVVLTSLNQIKPIIDIDPIWGVDKYLPYSDVQTVMYSIEDVHYKRKIIYSNQQMIDSCNLLICYVNTKSYRSGAKIAVQYAKCKRIEIVNLFE